MENEIRIRVFNTLELNTIVVSGWYSYKSNPNQRLGLFTGTTGGFEYERQVRCMKFMEPDACIPRTDLGKLYIKIRHCDRDLVFEHEYINWTDDICIGWLRAGNLGDDTVNWFFNGQNDYWNNGGAKGDSLVVSHRIICGNISPSVGLGTPSSETSNDTEKKESAGGHYVRPGSENSNSASVNTGHYVRPGAEESNTDADERPHYVRPGSEKDASTPNRLYPTGKGSILKKYMNEDGSPKEPGRAYPTRL
ncbi:MAG: hypothetical protein SOY65_07490 [Marinifilaceae bacterium]|nr:hypothetical protein [Marinifilaceae bacterium]